MDGKGRWIDNVVIERWFRSLKIEHIYPYEYLTPKELRAGINKYVREYNFERSHQTHGYQTPCQVYLGKASGLIDLGASPKPRPRRRAGAPINGPPFKGYGLSGSQGLHKLASLALDSR
jgi:hypothetical protein